MDRKLRIVYMGTPDFAVEPLRVLVESGYRVVAVITAPDKPAGRGQKRQSSPVKEFALANHLPILQPTNLKDPGFIRQLQDLNANLQVVVAFRMLPEAVWQMPELGTLNLHASLLPQYRGAAPINHAIINGETETGLTTFFIEKEIDTGKIILSRKIQILPSDDAGMLHDRLMVAGGSLMLETLKRIETGEVNSCIQASILPEDGILKPAPKIFKKDCKIDWDTSCIQIHNLVRGLSPFPGAFSNLYTDNEEIKQVKIYKTSYQLSIPAGVPGTIITDHKNALAVVTRDGLINLEELQLEGKKRLAIPEFLRGVHIAENFHF